MKKYHILFDLNMQYHLNSLFPLYKVMENDPQYDIYFRVGKDPKKVFNLIKISTGEKIARKLIQKGCKLTENKAGFDLVVSGDALEKPEQYGHCIKMTLDHGVGIKTSRIRNIVSQKDYHYHVILEGQYWLDYIKSLNWSDKASFHLTGMPKLDPLFKPEFYDSADLFKKMKLNPTKKTILFAPSYKPTSIDFLKDSILDLVPRYNLIIKLHPYSWGGRYAPHRHHNLFQKMAKRNKDIFLIPRENYDIYPYLMLSDTLISETSSVIHEFLAIGKFGVIFDLPEFKQKHHDGMDTLSLDPKKWLAGAYPHFSSPDNLIEAVNLALNPTTKMINKLNEYRNYTFTGLDGHASDRVKSLIQQLLEEKNE